MVKLVAGVPSGGRVFFSLLQFSKHHLFHSEVMVDFGSFLDSKLQQ